MHTSATGGQIIANNAPHSRRWFQFRLRTLLLLVTLLCLALRTWQGIRTDYEDLRREKDVLAQFDKAMNGKLAWANMTFELAWRGPSWAKLLGGPHYWPEFERVVRIDFPFAAPGNRATPQGKYAANTPESAKVVLEQVIRLGRLEWLNLGGMPISDGDLKEVVQNLPDLKVLNLIGASVSDAGLKHLPELRDLEYLLIGRSIFSYAAIDELESAMPRLKVIGRTEGTSHGDSHVAFLRERDTSLPAWIDPLVGDRNRQVLCRKVGVCFFSDDHCTQKIEDVRHWLSHLYRFPELRILNFGGYAVEDEDLVRLPELGKLEYLSIGRTNISASALAELQRFPALKYLMASPPQLSSDGLARLQRLTSLSWLIITSEGRSDELVTRVRAALPRVTIYVTEPDLPVVKSVQKLQWALPDWAIDILAPGVDGSNTRNGLERLFFSEFCELLSISAYANCGDDDVARLAELPHLESLYLPSPKLTAAGWRSIAAAKGLTQLSVDDSELNDQTLTGIASLWGLKELDITSLAFTPNRHPLRTTPTGWKCLANLELLEKLTIHAPISDGDVTFLDRLQRLKKLHIVADGTATLGDEIARRLQTLCQSEDLMILVGPVSKSGMRAIAKLPKLEKLHIGDPEFDEEALLELVAAKGLTELHVFSSRSLAKLEEALKASIPDARRNIRFPKKLSP